MIHLSCGWVACFHRSAPLWLLPALGAMMITWHGSFQHEAVYDQFSSKRWLYNLVAYLPLTLGVPFRIYRRTHRARYNFNILTDPRRGSESLRMDQASWSQLPSFPCRLLIYLPWQALPGFTGIIVKNCCRRTAALTMMVAIRKWPGAS